METLVILQILLFLSFPVYIMKEHGVLSSISAGSYRLRNGRKYWFALWLVSLAFTMYWHYDVLGFFAHTATIGFCISGMSPNHKRNDDSSEDELHMIGTVVAIASLFLAFLILHWMWLLVFMFVAGTILLWWKAPNWIWWTEKWAMACAAWGLLSI